MNAPVRFRTANGEWLEGTTVNISAVGVLIRTTRGALPEKSVELRIGLTDSGVWGGPHVACSGRILRMQTGPEGEALVAMTIDRFQLRPAALADEAVDA